MNETIEFLQLLPDENELGRVKGACLAMPGHSGRKIHGEFTVTDKRILFEGQGGNVAAWRPAFSLPYGEVTRIENCTVGLFIPTGIRLYARGGGFYTISEMKRKEIAAFLQEKIQQ